MFQNQKNFLVCFECTFCHVVLFPAFSSCPWFNVSSTECCEMGKDLEIRMPTNQDLQLRSYSKEIAPVKLSSAQINKSLLQGKKDMDILNDGAQDKSNNKHHKENGRIQADDKIRDIVSSDTIIRIGLGPSETITEPSIISDVKDKVVCEMKELPSLDLNLKRLRSIGEGGKSHKDDRNILKHSDQSAFSRYIYLSLCNGVCLYSEELNSSFTGITITARAAVNLSLHTIWRLILIQHLSTKNPMAVAATMIWNPPQRMPSPSR